jgi:hypothetical protein
MDRKITLSAVNSELRLRTNGITLTVRDPNDQQRSGRLRIGKGIIEWTPKFKQLPKGRKNWDQLIEFLKG